MNEKFSLQPTEKRKPVLIVSRSHAGRVHNASKIALGEDVIVKTAAGSGKYASFDSLASFIPINVY